jgi:acetylornithine deacetylase
LHPPVPGLQTDEDASIVHLVSEISGNNIPSYVAYATEAGQFAEAGFESIICGPGSIEQAHRANEFVSIEQLNLGVQMIENLVEKISK